MPLVTLTATTPSPCACCGIGNVVMSCRTRGGTASMCGYPEFVSPSTPPAYYLTLSQGGSYTDVRYSDFACAVPNGSTITCTWSGACNYDSLTCVNDNAGIQNCGGVNVANCGNLGSSFGGSGCGGDSTCTQTRHEAFVSGSCHPVSDGNGNSGKYSSANQFAQLSNADTEDNAIARLLAGPGGVWSAYTPMGDGSGGTCVPTACCLAAYQQRTGASFSYQESQFKLVLSALDPSTAYVVNVEIYRRLQGSSDPWELLLVSAFGFTSDGSGNYTITDQDVPNLEGYETYACCPLIYKP